MADDFEMEEQKGSTGAAKATGVLAGIASALGFGGWAARSNVRKNIVTFKEGGESATKLKEALPGLAKGMEADGSVTELLGKAAESEKGKALTKTKEKAVTAAKKTFDELVTEHNPTGAEVGTLAEEAKTALDAGKKTFEAAEKGAVSSMEGGLTKLAVKEMKFGDKYWNNLTKGQKGTGIAIAVVSAVALGAIVKGIVNKMTKPKTFVEQVESSREAPAAVPSR